MDFNNIINDAIIKFKPIIYLDSRSNYFPIDFNEYIRESKLKNKITGKVITDYLTPETFYYFLNNNPGLNNENFTLFLPRGKNSNVFERKSEEELAQTPLYVSILKTKDPYEFYIRYIHMYAYNGALKVCGCIKAGAHYADKEHITVHVRYNPTTKDIRMIRTYYSRHSGGVWLDPRSESFNSDDIIQFNETHPIVYSAYHSHASYNNDLSSHYRFWYSTTDVCDKGYRWDSQRLVRLEDNTGRLHDDTRWIIFKGDLGDGHVADFPNNDWWREPDKEGYYQQNLWWCFN